LSAKIAKKKNLLLRYHKKKEKLGTKEETEKGRK
jgi:hypothetical protein